MSALDFSRDGSGIRRDIIAGLTVGMVLVPQAMAYASLAGMPPVYGLYAATIPVIIGSCFGYCPILNTGPVAMTSLLTLAALTPLAVPGSEHYIALAALLAILVGVVRIIAGFCKASFLVDFISHPVMTGFSAAAGITIASTQIPKIFGNDPGIDNPIVNSFAAMKDFSNIHTASVIIGVVSLVAMFVIKKINPRLPNILIVLVLATLASWYFDFAGNGGHVVGIIPEGLPSLSLPADVWGETLVLLPSAILVAIIGLLEVMAVASAYKASSDKDTDIDKELVGQGLASAAAGCASGFPVSGSLSRSSLTNIVGAKSGLAAVISALLVIVTLLWATPLLKPMPMPALAAAIVAAVVALVRIRDFKHCWLISKKDGIVAIWTCVCTLALAPNMVWGILAGIGLSMLLFLLSIMRPRIIVLTQAEIRENRDDSYGEDTLHLRHDGRLFFLNARSFARRVQQHITKAQAENKSYKQVCVDCSSINDIDSTAMDHLSTLRNSLKKQEIELKLIHLKSQLEACFLRNDTDALDDIFM